MASADILRVAHLPHCPLPWSVEGPLRPGPAYRIRSSRGLVTYVGDPVTASFDRGNADLIVRACNAHYQMLEALKAALPCVEAGRIQAELYGEEANIGPVREIEQSVRAAIAAAEAEAGR